MKKYIQTINKTTKEKNETFCKTIAYHKQVKT